MYQSGGRIEFTANGRRISPRGKADIESSQIEHETQMNHDGTLSRVTKPIPAKAVLTFDRGKGLKWDKDFFAGFFDCSVWERDAGVLHQFTGATWTGKSSLDTSTGEVTGLSIETDQYIQTKA